MKKNNFSELILSICVFLVGLCLTLWADKVTNLVSVLLGSLAILYGIVAIVNYFRENDKLFHDTLTFIYGIIVFVVGLVLVIKVDFLKELISFVIGIYIVLSSIIKLSNTINLQKELNTNLTSSIVISIITILLGFFCIIGKFLIPDIIVTFMGIMIAIYGILGIINFILLRRK